MNADNQVVASTSSDFMEVVGNEGIRWQFSQAKGNVDAEEGEGVENEADIISCVKFSHDGEFLAAGDKGGRIVIFQRDQNKKFVSGRRSTDYKVYSTFQSHEQEFDYLKSLEIEEKINQIEWLRRKNAANFILSTNDKTIKLWKISERVRKCAEGGWNVPRLKNGAPDNKRGCTGLLMLPRLVPMDVVVEASLRRVYANAHAYHVNSVSASADQETFFSADDLRINLWHLEVTDESFNIVDMKPKRMEELFEVITAAEFHPKMDHIFAYSSSKGSVRLCDMRQRALCDVHAKMFEESNTMEHSFFSEILSSVSHMKFSHDGRYVLTRDYLNVKVWDINMESRPVEVYPVHNYLRSRLCTLYEGDCIFDKFEISLSGDDKHILTGSYNDFFCTFNRSATDGDSSKTYEVRLEEPGTFLNPLSVVIPGGLRAKKRRFYASGDANSVREVSAERLDYSRRILHHSWHPNENIIALATTNRLFVFEGI